jgi:hypothetical protein
MSLVHTEMIPKEPVVKLLKEIQCNIEEMGKSALKNDFNQSAAAYVSARLAGKIEQYLESIANGEE